MPEFLGGKFLARGGAKIDEDCEGARTLLVEQGARRIGREGASAQKQAQNQSQQHMKEANSHVKTHLVSVLLVITGRNFDGRDRTILLEVLVEMEGGLKRDLFHPLHCHFGGGAET